jgi:16S rRNA C1402 N4-methylase RsmH
VEVNPPTSTEATTSHSNVDELRAVFDTGYLVGDTISQEIVDSLDASHLLYDVNTTICSGFNNQCTDKFQCLKININFFNEINSLRENFNTVFIVLKNSPILIIVFNHRQGNNKKTKSLSETTESVQCVKKSYCTTSNSGILR